MTATTRVERDSMGSLDVPAEALWGAQTQRALQNFPPSGLRMPRAFIRALALIKQAAAAANAELGDLPPAIAKAIEAAAAQGRRRRLGRSVSDRCISDRLRHQQQYERQ